jgi:hypothetical protein
MTQILAAAPELLQVFKIDMIKATGLSKDALHIYFGLSLFVVVRLCWRWRGGWILAWLAVLAMALGVEWLDLQMETLKFNIRPDDEHWHDIWNTLFWPTVLLLVGHWLQPKPRIKAEPEAESGDLANQPFEHTPPV